MNIYKKHNKSKQNSCLHRFGDIYFSMFLY